MTSSITPFQPEIPLTVPHDVVTHGCWISDDARRLGMHIMGAPGSGKSRLGGRLLCFTDFLQGRPQIILDPVGGTIDNFLDRMICLPPAYQEKLWPRIRYTDLGATDYVTPLPLFYALQPDEPYAVTAGRYPEVIRRTDPHLQTASVEGWNPLKEISLHAGMMAASVQGQITDMVDLITHPEQWLNRHKEAVVNNPQLHFARAYFQFFIKLSPDRQRRLAGSLLTKVNDLMVHPSYRALVGSRRPGITLQQVDHHCLTWLIDGRNLPAAYQQELQLWTFGLVPDYLRHRGSAGYHRPLHFFIDELPNLFGFSSLQNEAMEQCFEQLLTEQARNLGCLVTAAHQSLQQISSERIRAALLGMGTQIIGRMSAQKDRLLLADEFLRFDPGWVKKRIPVYFNMAYPEIIGSGHFAQTLMMPNPQVIDYTTEEYSIDEQRLLLADRFRSLSRDCYLVRSATAEGSVSDELFEMTTAPFDTGRYPDAEQGAETRRQLRERDGYPVAELNAEIEQMRQETIGVQSKPTKPKQPTPPATPSPQHDTLKPGDPADATNDSLSSTNTRAEPPSAGTGYRSRWQKTEGL